MNIQQKIIKASIAEVIQRLSVHDPDAYDLLIAASVYRTPVSKEFLFAHLDEWDEERKEKALDSLRTLFLIKETIKDGETLFFLETAIAQIARTL